MKQTGLLGKAAVAEALDDMAGLLEVQGENPFRVRAYKTAARVVTNLAPGVLLDPQKLDEVRGIGKDLAAKIVEIARTGTCGQLDTLRLQVPPVVLELLHVPGIGPQRVVALRRALPIASLDQLRKAAEEGRLRTVRGFGPKLEQRILDALHARLDKRTRVPLEKALSASRGLLGDLASMEGVQQAFEAGSLRRRKPDVGDIDLLAIARDPAAVARRFTSLPAVRSVIARGTTRSSVVLHERALQVDLRVVEPASAGAAWVYFTGSKAHNVALRRLAQGRDLKLNEYGLFRDAARIAGASEQEVYAALGLDWIPPELREDDGEIEAAQAHALPQLVERADLRGELRVQTGNGAGDHTLQAMAQAARAQGLAWMAVTDAAFAGGGIDAEGLARQSGAIDALNEAEPGFTILKGVEVEILRDGRLALPDEVLDRLDVVVGCIRTARQLSGPHQTERLLRALDNPRLGILGAMPGGRFDVDWSRVLEAARQRGCHLEMQAGCDLPETAVCRQAGDAGVLLNVSARPSSPADFARLDHVVFRARRAWLRRDDVLNARPLAGLRALLPPRSGHGTGPVRR